MARSVYDVREEYTGNGSLAAYTFDFKIEEKKQLLVIELDENGDELNRVRGTDTSFLSSVTFDDFKGGGTVTLAANLDTSHKLILLLANDEPTQEFEFRNKGSFTLKNFEKALDFIAGAVQRLAYLMGRTMKLDESTSQSFDPTLPAKLQDFGGHMLKINEDGDGFELTSDQTGIAGDYSETIDDTDYSGSPNLSDYDPDTNKIIFTGGGITSIDSILAGVPGERLMLINAQGSAFTLTNEDAGETAANRISTSTGGNLTIADGSGFLLNYDGDSNSWRVIAGLGGANMTGPGSSTDNAIARYDGTTGQILLNSLTYLADNGALRLGNNIAPHVSAGLDLTSTTHGFLPPAMTTAQRDAIPTPATGLEIYNTDSKQAQQYNGTSWVSLGSPEEKTQTIADNQSTYANITDLSFDAANLGSVTVRYTIYRADGTNERRETGYLEFSYKKIAATWELTDRRGGADDALNIADSIAVTTSSGVGQAQYKSDSMGGTYSGDITWKIVNTTNIE